MNLATLSPTYQPDRQRAHPFLKPHRQIFKLPALRPRSTSTLSTFTNTATILESPQTTRHETPHTDCIFCQLHHSLLRPDVFLRVQIWHFNLSQLSAKRKRPTKKKRKRGSTLSFPVCVKSIYYSLQQKANSTCIVTPFQQEAFSFLFSTP